jgi:hypothetical protein
MKLNVTQKLVMTLALWMLATTAAWADYTGYTRNYVTANGLIFKRQFTEEDPSGSTCVLIRPSEGNKEVWALCYDTGQYKDYAPVPEGTDPEKHVGPDGEKYQEATYVIPSNFNNYKLVAIAQDAFKENPNIVSITFPDQNVTEIPYEAFYKCTSLASLNFNGSSIEVIREGAFKGCTSLKSIDGWGVVHTIRGSRAFGDCTALEKIVIGKDVMHICGTAFAGDTSVETLIFEDGDKKIQLDAGGGNEGDLEDMFYGCPISKIYYGRKMMNNVGDGVLHFHNPCMISSAMKALEVVNVEFGEKVDSIRNGFFAYFEPTIQVSAPHTTYIGTYAFYNTKLKGMDAPKIKYIDQYAFEKSTLSDFNFYSVEEIGNYAFQNSRLTNVSLPATLKYVGVSAFNLNYTSDEQNEAGNYDDTSSLKTFTIEDGDEPIELGFDRDYFEEHKNDESDYWETIAYSRPWLSSLTLEEIYIGRPVAHEPVINPVYGNVEKFADVLSFRANSFPKLKKVELTKVTMIDDAAFQSGFADYDPQSSLEEVSLPMLKAVPSQCFYHCPKLKTVNIPKAETIWKEAFAYASADLDLSFINTVDSIKERCFMYSSIGPELTIPASLKFLGTGVFSNCESLKKVTFEYGEKPLGMEYSFANNYAYSGRMVIGGGKCGIEEFYFDRNVEPCTYIDKSGETPVTYTYRLSIARGSGDNSIFPNLKTVTIGKKLTSLDGYSIEETELEYILCENPEPIAMAYIYYENDEGYNADHSEGYSFSNHVQEEVQLLVPDGSVSKYLNADVWKGFKNLTDSKGDLGSIEITIPKEGITTYSGLRNLDFSKVEGVKAYIASSYDADAESVQLSQVTDVTADQYNEVGVVIKGAAGTYQVPVVANTVKSAYVNMLASVPSDQRTIKEEGYTYFNYSSSAVDVYNCYLKNDQFVKISGSKKIGPNAAYLMVPESFKTNKGDALTVTLGSATFTPLYADVDLDFTNVQGLEAYCATGFANTGTVTLTRVFRVSAHTPLLLKGTPETAYTIPSERVKAVFMNMLVSNPSDNELTIEETTYSLTNFYLDGDKFKKVKTSATIPGYGVYLNVPTITVGDVEEYSIAFKEPETMKLGLSNNVSISIGKSGKASYCGDESLDFSYSEEVKAYIATGYDKDAEIIWLTRVKDVPAGVPVLIKGEAEKTYEVPVTDSQNSYYKNMFVGNTSGDKIQVNETDGVLVNYYLSGDGVFKSVKGYANIGNNKCYLQLPGTFNAAVEGSSQTVTLGASGKASYAAPVDLDFTNVEGLKAFSATGYDKSSKTIWLTRVMKVQKGEGVLLKGDSKDYEIPSTGVQSSYMNMFVGNTSGDKIQVQETSADGSQTNFYLKSDGTFVSVNGYVNIGNNKCYLELPTSMVAVAASTRGAEGNYVLEEPEVIKLPISFRSIDNDGDGTTGIKDQSSMFHVQSDAYYTLQGQRVVNPGKGLYIKNGKKVIVR